MGRGLGHMPTRTRRTKPSPFTTEGQEDLFLTRVTSQAQKAIREEATLQVRIGIPKHFLRPRERTRWSPQRPHRRPPCAADTPARPAPRRRTPAPGGARRCTARLWLVWTGAAGWGRVAPQGWPGATAPGRATGKAGGHDVGTSGGPDAVLQKQGPLTPAAWQRMPR